MSIREKPLGFPPLLNKENLWAKKGQLDHDLSPK